MKTATDTMAEAKSVPKTVGQTSKSKDGRWKTFHKYAGLMQYIPSGVYFARSKVQGKAIRRSLETDVFTTAKLRLPDKVKEMRKPPAEVGTFAEARSLYLSDVDIERGEIKVHNANRSKTSQAHDFRYVPIIGAMRELLERLQREQQPQPTDRGCVLSECQKSLTRGCQLVGCARITHHDLRHLFATRCIESGVDIPTVSRWLGHVDGGALAMKVYGHLRRDHSQSMAAKVTFGKATPENVIPMTKVERA